MSEVQIAIIDQEDTQITLAVPGVQGPSGAISSGGSANQVFYKVSGTNYDAGWTFIGNANVDAAAAIAGTKISPNFGSQATVTTGTNTAASFIPTSATIPSNGIYLPGANQVGVATNGTRRLIILSDGKVGLGAASVLQQGSGVDGGSAAGILELYNGGTGNTTLENTGAFSILFKTNNNEGLRITSVGTVNIKGAGTAGSTQAVSFNGSAPVNSMVLDSSGRLGIGTSTPQAPLHIEKSIVSNDTHTGAVILARTSNIGSSLFHQYSTGFAGEAFGLSVHGGTTLTNTTYTKYLVSQGGTHVWYGSTTATEHMRLTPTGLGIGTTSPGSPLTIESSAGNQVKITYPSVASYFLNATSGGDFAINKDGTERARIDSSGRLLVGTSTSPTVGQGQYSRVVIQGFTGNNSGQGMLSLASGKAASSLVPGSDGVGEIVFSDNSGIDLARITCQPDANTGVGDYPSRLVFSTTPSGSASPSPRMTISQAGHVLIAQTTGDYNTVGNSLFANGTAQFVSSSVTTFNLNRKASDGVVVQFYRDTNTPGSISVTTTATTYATSSDYRLKENVAEVTDGITRLQQLKPSRFNFIADPDKTVDGFIAHEVQDIVPEAITGEKDAVDDDGNPVYQGIDQSKLVPLLTAALQEAVAKIESLEVRLTAAGL